MVLVVVVRAFDSLVLPEVSLIAKDSFLHLSSFPSFGLLTGIIVALFMVASIQLSLDYL